jgi:hypothetical protein
MVLVYVALIRRLGRLGRTRGQGILVRFRLWASGRGHGPSSLLFFWQLARMIGNPPEK